VVTTVYLGVLLIDGLYVDEVWLESSGFLMVAAKLRRKTTLRIPQVIIHYCLVTLSLHNLN
jgi:hypothetical protein